MESRRAEGGDHAEGSFEGAGGLRLYFQTWRPTNVTPRAALALVHGFGGHSGLFAPLVDGLVTRGYAIYGFDLRGMGRSPGPRGYIRSWSDYRQDVQAFLHMIGEREAGCPLFLVGESLGGLIVLDYAQQRPEGIRGVIAFSPVLGEIGVPPVLLMLGRILSRVWPRFAMSSRMDFDASSRDPEAVQRFATDPLLHSRGTARLSTEFAAARARANTGAAGFPLPLLILHGDADRLATPDGSREFVERVTQGDSRLQEYRGGYHMLLHDLCADQVVQDVEAWIEGHL